MEWSWCISGTSPWCLGWIVEKLGFPGALAVLLYRFAVLQLKKKRTIDFAEKQLAEFYAPMLGARAEILSHTKFDQHMKNASYREHSDRLDRERNRPISSELLAEEHAYRESLERFFGNINARLLGERIEAYIAMRTLFAKKMAYADEDTRQWYEYFYDFVEMWRVIRDNEKGNPPALSDATVSNLGTMFDEELLQPFYRHLKDRCDYLQNEVSGRRANKAAAPAPPSVEPFAVRSGSSRGVVPGGRVLNSPRLF